MVKLLKFLRGGHPIVAAFVCGVNLNLVMESVSRKAPALRKSVSVPWPFL